MNLFISNLMLKNIKIQQQHDNSHQVLQNYNQDTNPNKMNLSIGLLIDTNGKPILHKSVIKAEQNIINQYNTDKQIFDKVYPEEGGSKGFLNVTQQILLGETKNDLISIATPSCGSLVLAYQLCKQIGSKTIHIGNPGWQMHQILNQTVGLKQQFYNYIKNGVIDIDDTLNYIDNNVKELDIFMIQFSCNNPTGIDYNIEQLNIIFNKLNQIGAIALVDVAYQGIATGSIEIEQSRIKQCFNANQLILCQFFDKNFTIYSEGCSAMHLYVKDANEQQRWQLRQQLIQLQSSMFGLAPVHGQQIVQEIWNNEELRNLYRSELKEIFDHVQQIKMMLQDELNKQNVNINVINQIGIYAFFPIKVEQVITMAQKYHIYMLENGRINLCGINKQNVQYFVSSLKKILE